MMLQWPWAKLEWRAVCAERCKYGSGRRSASALLTPLLTPNNAQTRTMSVLARENLFDFDKFSYGAAASTMLFLIIASITVIYMWLGRVNTDGAAR